MKVLIVSGFLGAGKTTFIKALLRVKDSIRPVILENEYGQNNLDSRELKGANRDLKLLEFMEGCVCCSKRDDFSQTILTISASLDPEYLIVEPTGVGKLSNILAAVEKVSYGKIELLKPVVVLTPRSFEKNLAEFPEIYSDQIRNAGRIVFSKAEHESSSVIAAVTEKIRALNPDVKILSDHYTTRPKTWFENLFASRTSQTSQTSRTSTTSSSSDEVMEVSVSGAYLNNVGELVVFLEDLLHKEFGLVTRAKGVLKVGSEFLRFDLADNLYAIIAEANPEPTTQCVFIGRDILGRKVKSRLNSLDLFFRR